MTGAADLRPLLAAERAEGRWLWLFGLLLLIPLALLASTAGHYERRFGELVARGSWLFLYVISTILRQARGTDRWTARFTSFETTLPTSMRRLAWARFRADAWSRIPPFAVAGLCGLALANEDPLRFATSTAAMILWLGCGDAAFRFLDRGQVRIRESARRAVFVVEAGAVVTVILEPALAGWMCGVGMVALCALLRTARVPDMVSDDRGPGSARAGSDRASRALPHASVRSLLIRQVSLSPPVGIIALWSAVFVPALIHLGQGLIFYIWLFPIFAAGLAGARARFMARFGHLPVRSGHLFAAMFVPLLVAIGVAFAASLAVGVRAERSGRDGVSVCDALHDEHGTITPQQLAVPVGRWSVGLEPRPEIELADDSRARVAAFKLGWLPVYAHHPYMVPADAGLGVWSSQLARALDDVYAIDRKPAELEGLFEVRGTRVVPSPHSALAFRSALRLPAGTRVRDDRLWRGAIDWLAYLVFFGISAAWWMRDLTPAHVARPWRPVLLWGTTLAAALGLYWFFALTLSTDLPLGPRDTLTLLVGAVVPLTVPGVALISSILVAGFGLLAWRLARRSSSDMLPDKTGPQLRPWRLR